MNKNRLIVIGMDGATFDVINPLIAKGKLPNLLKLISEGSSGPLKSTTPPISALAWPSFYTGKNPGKHGIFGFTRMKHGTYNIEPVNAANRHSSAIWSLLSSYGEKGIVINVPITYPADEINGFFISGMDAPGLNNYSVHPSSLKHEILKEIGDYLIECDLDLSLTYKTAEMVLRRLKKTEYLRLQTAKYLMRKIDWDYLMIVFVASDRVQHAFWHCMDPFHPRHNEKGAKAFTNAIEETYTYLDDYLGYLLSLANSDDSIIILSDHGMKPFDRILPLVDMNEMLSLLGYLKFKRIRRVAAAKLFLSGWRVGKSILPVRFRQFIKRKLPVVRNSLHLTEVIDWNNSKAFAPFFDMATAGGVCVNLKGREPLGVVESGEPYEELRDELISKLEHLKHPLTGKRIIQKVFRREVIYSGKYINEAPDLVIKWNEENIFSGKDSREKFWGGLEEREERKLDLSEHTGEHAQDGILIAKGMNIKRGAKIKDASIIDIAPTILFLKQLPVPTDMDGIVLNDIFNDEFLKENNLTYIDPEALEKISRNFEYSEQERQAIKNRLRDLGYL